MNPQIKEAIEFAATAHRDQIRKTTGIPFIVHPFTIAMMLLQKGASDDVIIASLLHDVVEDTSTSLAEIKTKFGDQVAEIVLGCTDPPKEVSWQERREIKLHKLKNASLAVKQIVCVDSLHNLQSIREGLKNQGENVWQKFSVGRDKQQWFYSSVVEILSSQMDDSIISYYLKELETTLHEVFHMQ